MDPAAAPLNIAVIGAGRLGQTLAMALAVQGETLRAVAGRRPPEELATRIGGRCRATTADAAVALADLVFLTVPDDAIGPLAAALPWRAGQAVVHCSGATELAALAPAVAMGARAGGFHPLQIFSDPARALALLPGSAVAIEADDDALRGQLLRLAGRLGMRPLTLRPGTRAAYHGAASFAASFLLSMLDESVQIWQEIGLPQDLALQALLPLARGTLDAAGARGLAPALAGPISRGDAGVVAAHLQALEALGGGHGALYREMSLRQLKLARESGRLSAEALQGLERVLGVKPGQAGGAAPQAAPA